MIYENQNGVNSR